MGRKKVEGLKKMDTQWRYRLLSGDIATRGIFVKTSVAPSAIVFMFLYTCLIRVQVYFFKIPRFFVCYCCLMYIAMVGYLLLASCAHA